MIKILINCITYTGFTLNLGIKHVFLGINICWIPRVMFKPEPEGWGF